MEIYRLIGTEAAVLTLLFGLVFTAIKISIADHKPRPNQDANLIPAPHDRPLF